MRLGGTITRIFKSFLVESETYTEDFEQITHEGRQVIYAAEGTHYFKDWEEESKDLDNAFIPVVNIIKSNDHQYNIKVVKDKVLTLDACIEEKLRKPEVKEIKLLVNKGNAKLKFNVTKGNPKANDSDGGNITAVFFDGKGKEIIRNELKDKKYGDTFELEIDATKKIHHIKFYANDNDIFFDGGVSNVYCGEVIFSGCYCNRDFTVEEMRLIVKCLRDNTFYLDKESKKSYSITHYHKEKLFYLQKDLHDNDKTIERFTSVLNNIFLRYGINTCIRKIHFFAQMYWETKYFTDLKENDNNYTDGYDPYRGRGFMQLTHLDTYAKYQDYSGYEVVKSPDSISKSLEISADSGGWFWSSFKKANYDKKENMLKYKEILGMNLSEISDFEDKYLNTISKLVNGGGNGKNERIKAYKVLKIVFAYDKKCTNAKK